MPYNPDYQTVSHRFDMKEKHEGLALKSFILSKTTIAALLRSADITRSTLNWVIDKQKLSERDKMNVINWLKTMWPNVERNQVFGSGNSGHNTIKGDNNNQATEGSTIQTGDSQLKERIISLEKEVKRLEEIIEAKDELISLYKQRHN